MTPPHPRPNSSADVLITGAGGFLGTQLSGELCRRKKLILRPHGEIAIDSLTLVDPALPVSDRTANGVLIRSRRGDAADPVFLRTLFRPDTRAVFHLAAMVSGQGEKDFDGCLRTNLDATRHLLELCRNQPQSTRLVFTSSVAIFGGHTLADVVSDSTKPLPQTTYGTTKVIGELLINDYSRKGFVDGRSARLPTVFIRPGQANAAASSFASALFREPLAGRPYDLPVSLDVEVPLLGYRRVIENLITLAECDPAMLGTDRTVTFPSTRWRVSEMIAALQRFAQARGLPLASIVEKPDPVITAIVKTWPVGTDASRVAELGLKSDASLEQVLDEYTREFVPPNQSAPTPQPVIPSPHSNPILQPN